MKKLNVLFFLLIISKLTIFPLLTLLREVICPNTPGLWGKSTSIVLE